MVKEASKVVSEFNELVNMTPDELKQWLGTEDSKSAGWTGGDGSGETVGHDSGNQIIKILESNPDKQEDKYVEEDIDHMRKVVSYCKRHLAQEEGMKDRKSDDELKETKSYKSLKNWGHDSLKKSSGASSGAKKDTKKDSKEKKDDKEDEAETEETPAAGDKRKADEAQDDDDKKKADAEAPEPKKAKETEAATEKDSKQDAKESEGNDKTEAAQEDKSEKKDA